MWGLATPLSRDRLHVALQMAEIHTLWMCRKISLLVHPDKCGHEQASAAFEVIGEAQKFILDADRREILMRVLEYAREAIREVRRKATKNDSAVRMAAALNAEGREGVEKEWEETADFHEKWRIKSQDVLARSEFRRRKLLKRYALPPPPLSIT